MYAKKLFRFFFGNSQCRKTIRGPTFAKFLYNNLGASLGKKFKKSHSAEKIVLDSLPAGQKPGPTVMVGGIYEKLKKWRLQGVWGKLPPNAPTKNTMTDFIRLLLRFLIDSNSSCCFEISAKQLQDCDKLTAAEKQLCST